MQRARRSRRPAIADRSSAATDRWPAVRAGDDSLTGEFGAGMDPCAAMQIRVALEPARRGGWCSCSAKAVTRACARADRQTPVADAAAAIAGVREHWDDVLDAVEGAARRTIRST
jgi:hypothetical protein